MTIAPEHRKDVDALPSPLRALLDAELAAGNAIIDVGHSHPAPPAGAYIKLARPVSTRARASGDGLLFYARNSSLYSGEFTDEKRFFFILEAPLPPPPEPDMNAIRTEVNRPATPRDAELMALAARVPRQFVPPPELLRTASTGERDRHHEKPDTHAPAGPKPAGPGAGSTSASHVVHFRDRRRPHEIRCSLERLLVKLMEARTEDDRLTYHVEFKQVGASYSIQVTFVGVLQNSYAYTMHLHASWADMPATHHDYYRKTSDSWFALWMRDFMRASPPREDEFLSLQYGATRDEALHAESDLQSVAALQHAILAALHDGATYATSHKEGGTQIRWEGDRFVRADFGESDTREEFRDAGDFLTFLRRFYDWETSRAVYPEKVPELDAWRLMLRLLRRRG